MVQTITPVVHGGSRKRWGVSVAVHALGATLTAGALGAALGSAGLAVGAPWGRWGPAALAVVAAVYAARELTGVRVPLPQLRRQVPEWWRTFFSPNVSAFLYGAGLGLGFLTYVSFGTFAVVAGAAALSGHPLVGMAVLGPFGLARGLAVTVVASGRTAEGVNEVVDGLDRMAVSRVPRTANGLLLALVAGVAIWTGLDGQGDATSGIAPIVLAAVFGWAGSVKVLWFGAWRTALARYRLPTPVEVSARFLVPAAELAVPALFVAGAPLAEGLLALGLLAVFSATLVRTRRLVGSDVPCGCFGGTKTRDYRLLLLRNGAVGLLAMLAAADSGSTGLGGISAPHLGDIVPVVLLASGVLLGAMVVRQAGEALRGRQ